MGDAKSAAGPAKQTPLRLAYENNKKDIVEYLFDQGVTIEPSDFHCPFCFFSQYCDILFGQIDKYKQDNVAACEKEALFCMCSVGTLEELKEIIKKRGMKKIHELRDDSQKNVLCRAVENLAYGKEVLQHLVEECGCKNLIEEQANGKTLMHFMVSVGESYLGHPEFLKSHSECLEYLVSQGAKFGTYDNDGMAPLHLARHLQNIDSLIKCGANIDLKNKKGQTLLNLVVRESKLAVIEYLLKKGADVNAKDNDGYTIIHEAVRVRAGAPKDFVDTIIRYLVEHGAELDAKNNYNMTALEMVKLQRRIGADAAVAYLEMAEDFYAVNNKQMTFEAFAKKHLEKENGGVKLTDIFNLLHLGKEELVNQFIDFVDQNELLAPAGYNFYDKSDNKKRWFYLNLAKRHGIQQSYWTRKCFECFDRKSESTNFDKAASDAVKNVIANSKLSFEDKKHLREEYNQALEKKKLYATLLRIPKKLPVVKITKILGDSTSYCKNGFKDIIVKTVQA